MSATINPENFGKNLRRLVKEQFGTQESFANALSKSTRQVRRWFSDGIDDIDTAMRIANVLNTTPQALFS